MIAIIDYGMGNLRSVQKAFEYIGIDSRITSNTVEISKADRLVLPGVGAFGDAMNSLRDFGLEPIIKRRLGNGVPFLGICLGYQVLFSKSYEEGEHKGLDVFKGKVIRLPEETKVPHVGWNSIDYVDENVIFKDIPNKEYFYFVHSYYVEPEDKSLVSSWTDYSVRFASSISKGNIFGVQFHPEKSSKLGLRILKNFGGISYDNFSGS